jgi:hypothetical protein
MRRENPCYGIFQHENFGHAVIALGTCIRRDGGFLRL